MRAGLQRRADRAQVDDALVARASGAARRRRTTRGWRWVPRPRWSSRWARCGRGRGDARHGSAPRRRTHRPPTATDPSPATRLDGGSARSTGASVQVDVPADWGYGQPDGVRRRAPTGTPYVGRPIGSPTPAALRPRPDPHGPATSGSASRRAPSAPPTSATAGHARRSRSTARRVSVGRRRTTACADAILGTARRGDAVPRRRRGVPGPRLRQDP